MQLEWQLSCPAGRRACLHGRIGHALLGAVGGSRGGELLQDVRVAHDLDLAAAARGVPAREAHIARDLEQPCDLGLDTDQPVPLSYTAVVVSGPDKGKTSAPYTGTLDGLGVDGDGAHTGHEHLHISSIGPRTKLLYRLYQTLK